MALTSKANVSSRSSEYLRVHRYRITLWIAAIEGLLVLLHVIPHIAVYVLAIVALAFWVLAARNYSSTTARQLSWIFAASQCLVRARADPALLREVDCDPLDHGGGRGGARSSCSPIEIAPSRSSAVERSSIPARLYSGGQWGVAKR